MPNHYHGMIVPVGDPHEIAAFMNYVDGEIAKIICRLLGRTNYKFWAQHYDAVPILTPRDVIRKIVYIFVNPVRAYQVENSEKYPGVTTFRSDMGEYSQEYCRYFPRQLERLPSGGLRPKLRRKLVSLLRTIASQTYVLSISPLGWKSCFSETREATDSALRDEILGVVREVEAEFRRLRRRRGIQVVGARLLREGDPRKPYRPKNFGRRVLVICSDMEQRLKYIATFRSFVRECRDVWEAWMRGDFCAQLPPAAFAPPLPPRSNLWPPGLGVLV